MNVINDIVVALQGIIGLCGLLFSAIFIAFGDPFKNFFNRGMLSFESAILLVMAYALERHAVAPSPPIPPGQAIPAIVAWGVLALVEVMFTGGLYQVLVSKKGGIRAAKLALRSRRVALTGEPRTVTAAIALLDQLNDVEFSQVMTATRPR